MAIKKDGERWKVDVQPGGRGEKRIRKWFDTKAEALRFERHIQAAHQSGKPWDAGEKRDKRRLNSLAELWFTHHGKNLKDGERRKRELLNIAEAMGNPLASGLKAKDFAEYRAKRLENVEALTANRDLAYVKAMFNELKRCGEWEAGNPAELVRKIKTDEVEM